MTRNGLASWTSTASLAVGKRGRKPVAPSERVWRFVEIGHPLGCWEWTGHTRAGYGRMHESNGRLVDAHRVTYEFFKGPIPLGLQIDHLCRNPCCVNPDHLEAVTPRENVLRGAAPGIRRRGAPTCIHGHLWNEKNTYITKQGRRKCRECARLRQQRRAQTGRAA